MVRWSSGPAATGQGPASGARRTGVARSPGAELLDSRSRRSRAVARVEISVFAGAGSSSAARRAPPSRRRISFRASGAGVRRAAREVLRASSPSARPGKSRIGFGGGLPSAGRCAFLERRLIHEVDQESARLRRAGGGERRAADKVTRAQGAAAVTIFSPTTQSSGTC